MLEGEVIFHPQQEEVLFRLSRRGRTSVWKSATAPFKSNPYKRFKNWNVCFSCGFMSQCGAIARRAPRDAAWIITRKDTTIQLTSNILRQDMSLA